MNDKLCLLGFCAGLGALGCSSTSSDNLSNKPTGQSGSSISAAGGAMNSGGPGGGDLVSTGVGGSDLGISVGDASPGAGGSMGSPEICDGIDNDGNGIVDDVDVGKDGVCDCLNIATVGEIGPWGKGTGVFTTWLSSRSPLGAVALGDQVLTDDLLKKFQVIVTLHTQPTEILGDMGKVAHAYHAFADSEVQAFTKWVKAGNGAMATIGYNYGGMHEEVNINKLFSPLGISYASDGYISGYITDWVDHPVTQGVHKINTTNGIATGGTGIVLAHESPQKVAFQGIEVGMGRALMWGDEWITYDDLWTGAQAQDQQVERLWLNILKWLTPPKQCQVPIPDRVN